MFIPKVKTKPDCSWLSPLWLWWPCLLLCSLCLECPWWLSSPPALAKQTTNTKVRAKIKTTRVMMLKWIEKIIFSGWAFSEINHYRCLYNLGGESFFVKFFGTPGSNVGWFDLRSPARCHGNVARRHLFYQLVAFCSLLVLLYLIIEIILLFLYIFWNLKALRFKSPSQNKFLPYWLIAEFWITYWIREWWTFIWSVDTIFK